MYGSSRLGMWLPNIGNVANSPGNANTMWQYQGVKQYELSNHLGNVIATISDRRIQTPDGGNNFHFDPDISTAQAYYAFGSTMPGQQFTEAGNTAYRYGFNGKEDDSDIDNGGQDYGMRIYDKRIGRFLSVDPLTSSYPMLTPYQFASNRPIDGIDIDGEEFGTIHINRYINGNKITMSTPTYTPYDSGQNNISGPKGDGVSYQLTTHITAGGITRIYNDDPIFLARKALTDYGNYYGASPLFKVLKSGTIDFGNTADPSYAAKPVDGADNFAMKHDKGYDALGAVGGNSLLHDWGTTPIDEMALNGWSSMSDAIANGNNIDPYNHQKVTRQEVGALHRGIALFAAIVNVKKSAISNFIADNIPGTKRTDTKANVEKNYQLFLQLYLIKNENGTYQRDPNMWHQDKDKNWLPNKPKN